MSLLWTTIKMCVLPHDCHSMTGGLVYLLFNALKAHLSLFFDFKVRRASYTGVLNKTKHSGAVTDDSDHDEREMQQYDVTEDSDCEVKREMEQHDVIDDTDNYNKREIQQDDMTADSDLDNKREIQQCDVTDDSDQEDKRETPQCFKKSEEANHQLGVYIICNDAKLDYLDPYFKLTEMVEIFAILNGFSKLVCCFTTLSSRTSLYMHDLDLIFKVTEAIELFLYLLVTAHYHEKDSD